MSVDAGFIVCIVAVSILLTEGVFFYVLVNLDHIKMSFSKFFKGE